MFSISKFKDINPIIVLATAQSKIKDTHVRVGKYLLLWNASNTRAYRIETAIERSPPRGGSKNSNECAKPISGQKIQLNIVS
jgi:hypothetical protein